MFMCIDHVLGISPIVRAHVLFPEFFVGGVLDASKLKEEMRYLALFKIILIHYLLRMMITISIYNTKNICNR